MLSREDIKRVRPVPAELLAASPRTGFALPALNEIRVGMVVEMQYRFSPTTTFGWWRGTVHSINEDDETCTIHFSHFDSGSNHH